MADPRESTKKEHLLGISEFNTSKSVSGLTAVATLIQNLLVLEPGTYPTNPDMGIGIEQYEFEFLDDETVNQIQMDIQNQIRTYIPTANVEELSVVKYKGPEDLVNTLYVVVKLFNPDTSESEMLAVSFNREANNSGVVSKIIV